MVHIEVPAEPSPWAFTGFLRSDEALWVERFKGNPLAKARQSLDLALSYKAGIVRLLLTGHGEYDLAYLAQRDSYDKPTLRAYEWQVTTREAFLALSLGRVELTVGRQIVAWGEGDALSPLDVVNPRDLREPGLADLDDLRLATLATRIGWFRGAHRVEAMVIHESDFGYRPAPLSDYSPFRSAIDGDPTARDLLGDREVVWDDRQPRFAFDQQEGLLRWVMKGAGVDLGLYLATVLDDQGVVVLAPADIFDAGTSKLRIGLDHRRYTVIGHSGATSFGDFLLKWELGAELRRPFTTGRIEDLSPEGIVAAIGQPNLFGRADAELLQTMAGLTWSGVTDLTLTLEISKPWLLSDVDDLLFDANAPFIALRASWRTLRERVRLDGAFSMIGWTADLGWLVRVQATWAIRDALQLQGGFISYHPGDEFGPLTGLDRHDRVFLGLRWDFQIL
ncbi:MAG: hypothetical protein H6744_20115 [Deltaproteobacteria bacterium]|nr:hypothetical protein [Deltaproteobacteria bacterium]